MQVNTSTAANNLISVTPYTEDGNTTYTVNFNGTKAAAEIPLTDKSNGDAMTAKTVKLSSGLDFTNGTLTTAVVEDTGVVKFNVNTTALSSQISSGKITTPTGDNSDGLVTAKEVAAAINAAYWTANASGNVDGTSTADNVIAGTKMLFAAGKNLKVKHTANNFTFSTADDVSFNNVTTNNLTVKNGGNVDMGGNQVHNVANGTKGTDAVNLDQLNATTATANAGWVIKANGTNATTVKPNATVSLNNTDGNILITKSTTDNNVTFNFNPNATFGVVGKDGKDGVDGSIGLTGPKGADGKDGVSLTLKPEKGTTTVNEKDASKEIERIKYTANGTTREVATLDDGLKFAGDDNAVINRTLGSQMNITGGADSTKLTDNNIGVVYDKDTNGLKVKLSKDVNLSKDGSITIGGTQVTNNGLTIKGGPSVTVNGVDAGNKKVTNVADGDINATSKDAVNGSQLYQAVNNINKNVNAAKTELEEGDNVTTTSRVGNNGQTIYKVSSNVKDTSAHVQGGSDAVSVTKAETTRKDGSTTVTDYTVDLSSKTKDDIKKGVDAHDTVTNKGLTFNADKGTTGAKKLGSQVAVNGDNKNIETVADTNGVKVKLKDDINVNSVTANTFKAGDTIVNTKGVQVAAKDDRGNNTNVVINEKGINAGNTRIQNVAAGRADTDAVNVSQLKGAVTQIGNHINKMDKNLRAGIAGAMAAGGLYHATLPGKSMVAAGAGTYKGESAVAVGYSRLSDNGKVGIKFSVNTNTRGDSGAAASVGYQW